MSISTRLRACRRTAVAALIFATTLVALGGAPAGADLAREDPDGAQELAERHAPVMVLKAQEEPCDPDGEPYGPTSVEIVLDNPDVVLRQVGRNDPVIIHGPGAADLYRLGEGMYLDFPGSALQPGCIYETDFNRYREDLPPATVYAHVVQQEDHPDMLAVQYWFYWYYNDWNNKHESDWEGIQVLFEASSIDEALASEPVSVGYAQHEGGERADWDASKLERDGNRPFVYSSAGSHASYFGSALYIGRSGSEGFGCDNTDGPSERFDPDVVVLPDSIDDADSELAWLAFEGRWGERQSGPFNGPTGPAAKDRWLNPIDWHDELRPSSVVIPAGDRDGLGVVTAFCEVVEWGSGTLIQITTSPVRLVISTIVLFLAVRWLVRRTDWTQVRGQPLVRRRRAGQILRAAGRMYRRSPGSLLPFGLVYIPTAFVVGLLGALIALIPLISNVLDLAEGSEGTNLTLAALTSGAASTAAYVAVNALVVTHMQASATDPSQSVKDSARAVWERRGDLASGFVRVFVLVVVLLLTVIGVPVAVWLIVRYQFIAHAVMIDGCDGRASLGRSAELVRGRWLHTAVLIGAFNLLLAGSALAVGLILLVVFAGIPLWLFSALTTLIYALITPLTAAAQSLLYGDAVAEERNEGPAEVLAAGEGSIAGEPQPA